MTEISTTPETKPSALGPAGPIPLGDLFRELERRGLEARPLGLYAGQQHELERLRLEVSNWAICFNGSQRRALAAADEVDALAGFIVDDVINNGDFQ